MPVFGPPCTCGNSTGYIRPTDRPAPYNQGCIEREHTCIGVVGGCNCRVQAAGAPGGEENLDVIYRGKL